jgi:acetyltransferase-like isoleucine patch superfamily enzyme
LNTLYKISYIIIKLKNRFLRLLNNLSSKLYTTCGKGSFFKENAIVHNLQKDRTKIIIGEYTVIEGKLVLFNFGGKITIGNNVFVGPNTNIWSAENVIIGNDVLISHGVNIIDTNSHEIDYVERAETYRSLIRNSRHPREKGTVLTKEIVIKDNVWISYNASVLKGVTVGKGAIIAANSVVTKDVPEFTLVAGNPARVVKKINI